MFQLLEQIGVVVLVAAIVCTQIFLLFKYAVVRGTLRRMQETSSGDHARYKNNARSRKANGTKNGE